MDRHLKCRLCGIICFVSLITLLYGGIVLFRKNNADLGNEMKNTIWIEETPYYGIFEKDNVYFCNFYDSSHSIIRQEGPMGKPPEMQEVEEGVFRISVNAGASKTTQWGYYYHGGKGIFSDTFYSIFDQHNGLVAYAYQEKVIVQSIFYNETYYKEIDSFSADFSVAAEPFVDVQFLTSSNSVSVTYYTGTDYEVITEVFPLD